MISSKARWFITAMLFIPALFLTVIASAQIKGYVMDSKTAEPLSGASVMLKETGVTSMVLLDGSFHFDHVASGSYTLEAHYENYETKQAQIKVDEGKTTNIKITLDSKSIELSNVAIVSGGSHSDENARNMEHNSDQLVNIVSARNIELSPDITVANVLQRVSGVTVEKNSSGEARYPIIRGMDKRYINTLVNGIKIPSPDNKSRFVPLDLFPSELVERLEVSKSLTPSMEGDAIGGTINLVMKDAPKKRLLQVNASVGYNNIFSHQDYLKFSSADISKKSPAQMNGADYAAIPASFPKSNLNYATVGTPINTTMGITYGERFGKNKKLGVLLAGSYQNIFSGTKSSFFLPNAQPGLNNIPQFIDLYARQYSTQNKRIGLNAKLDYKINEKNKISWVNTFVKLDMLQTRHSSDTIALNSLVDEAYRSTWQYQSIFNSTLLGQHTLTDKWALDWSGSYAVANNHLPDQSEFKHEFPVSVDPQTGTTKAGSPDILGTMTRNWLENSDKNFTFKVNLTLNTKVFQRDFQLKVGGLMSYKTRDNFYNAYTLNPQLQTGSSVQLYTNINDAIYTFNGLSATPALDGNNYTFNENITAGYIQGKWQLSPKLEALGGFRTENTYQKYKTALGPEVEARSGTIKYTDVLPSLQFKYTINEIQALRLSYYKALARPQFAELIPAGPDNYETFKEVGNPTNLRHSIADNLDLRYELFPGHADQALVGVFYKRIQDPIEYTAVKVGVTDQNLMPTNIGPATNYGFEAVFTKYVGMFGLSLNYTFTKSKVTNDSMLYSYRTEAGFVTSKYVSETRPLQGQANHVANLSLLYKNPNIGVEAQVALGYTGARIALVSPYAGLHYWQEPFTGLDFSFEKSFFHKLSLFGKVNNITNSPLTESLHVPYNTYIAASGARPLSLQTDPSNKTIVQKQYLNTSFLLGLRFKL